jgi:hypothetical protein
MTCNDVINNKALVYTLAYVKQKIRGIGAEQKGRTLPKQTYVCA